MIVAIPDSLVTEAPDWCLAVAAVSCAHGHQVVCAVAHHETEAWAVLGRYAAYVPVDGWLEGAVWVSRSPASSCTGTAR